ncbi:hypothetical protein HDK90DRAFT_470624 [Phyllosticta capitalensis]|uniref:Uncharacterized protein n=1 Tax=Phyllosticta capitalensis TaxID=121624 RepID=A0ABR1YB45_9PEZI
MQTMAQRSASSYPTSTSAISPQNRDSLSTSNISIYHPTSHVKDLRSSTYQALESEPESPSSQKTFKQHIQRLPRPAWGINIHDDPRFMSALREIHNSDNNIPTVPRRRTNANTILEKKHEHTNAAPTASHMSVLRTIHSPVSDKAVFLRHHANANVSPKQKHEYITASSTSSNTSAFGPTHNADFNKPTVSRYRTIATTTPEKKREHTTAASTPSNTSTFLTIPTSDSNKLAVPRRRADANTSHPQKHQCIDATSTPSKGSLSAGKRQPRRKLQRTHAFMIDRSPSPSGRVLEIDTGSEPGEDELCALFKNTCGQFEEE